MTRKSGACRTKRLKYWNPSSKGCLDGGILLKNNRGPRQHTNSPPAIYNSKFSDVAFAFGRQMKAIQVQKTGGPEALTLVDLPVPKPKPNEAVVKIAASGVNFIDVYFREGRYPAPLPFVDGQEAAGVISEVGSDVKALKPGDRVAYTGVLGAYAEYAAVPADRLVRVPAGITD